MPVFSETPDADITVSDGGKATITVRDPRPSRPPARKRRNETQAFRGFPFTFKCYGADVTVDGFAVCPEEP